MAFIHSVNVNIHDNWPSFVFSEMCSVSRVKLLLNTCVLLPKRVVNAKSLNCFKGRLEKRMEEFAFAQKVCRNNF